MFRRRTDHIYATLQNVQRRITQSAEQVGAGRSSQVRPGSLPADTVGGGYTVLPDTDPVAASQRAKGQSSVASRAATSEGAGEPMVVGRQSPAGTSVLPPNLSPKSASLDAERSPPPAEEDVTPAPGQPLFGAPPPSPLAKRLPTRPPTEAFRRSAEVDEPASVPSTTRGIQLPVEVIGLLLVVWVGTLFAAYVAGMQAAPAGDLADPPIIAHAGDGYAAQSAASSQDSSVVPGVTAHAPAGNPDIRPDRYIVVLSSVGEDDTQSRADYQNLVGDMNRWAADKELAARFGLRRPRSGGLQLVFGITDAGYGVERSLAEDLLRVVKRKYTGAKIYP